MAKALKKVALVIGAVAAVATGVGAIVGAGAFAAATGASLATVAAVGTVASVAAQALNMISPPKPKSSIAGSQTSFKLDPAAGIPYPVGRTFFAGNAVHRDTWGTDNQYQGFTIVWGGGGPIDAIEAFRYDEATISFDGAGNAIGGYKDFMWLRTQLGACPSPALTSPVAGYPGWGASSKLSGYAAGVWVVKFDKKGKKFAAGLGRPGAVIRAVKVYDPRLDSTYPGGSGSCRPLDEDTYVYSENPWLHALTWALGRWENGVKVIGVGMPIEQIAVASFVDAANVADANSWKCGGVVSSVDDKWDVLTMFAQAGGGQCIRLGAKLTAFVEAPRVAIATIRETDLVGAASIAGTQFERSRINGVVPIIRSEAHGWEQVPCDPVRFDTYVTEDGGRRTAETEFVLVQQIKQGAELAAYEVLNSREFGPIDLELKIQWLGIEPGDLVTLDMPRVGLAMQPALALARGVDPGTGNVALSLRSETASKHDVALGRTTTVAPSPGLVPIDISQVAAPGIGAWIAEGIQIDAPDGTAVPIIVARGATDNPNASHVVFEYRPVVDPVGAMPADPEIGDIATDATGAEFVYEAGGWARRWLMQATQDAGVTVQEFAAVTPLTAYEIGVSYVSRGVLGERRTLGPITVGAQSGYGRLILLPEPPSAENSIAGDVWQDTDGRYWIRREDTHLSIGGNRLMIGGNALTMTWTPAPVQPVRNQIDAALSVALSATAAAAQLAQDAQATADGKIDTYYQASPPVAASIGDLWFDTDDGYKQYRWSGSAWTPVQDTGIGLALTAAAGAQATADGKVRTFFSESTPTAEAIGDLWFKPSTGYLKRWDGASWTDVANVGATASQLADISSALSSAAYAQATADGKIDSFYQTSAPGSGTLGDLWFDTDDGNKVYRHNGTSWVVAQDSGIGAAITAAAGAQATADGKVTTFVSESTPTAQVAGDLWFKQSTGALRRWTGSSWGDPLVDLTAAALPRHEPASATLSFVADYQGTITPSDQLPDSVSIKRYVGTTNVSTDAGTTWSIVSQGAITGGTVTVSGGNVNFPAGLNIPTSTVVRVKSSRAGFDIFTDIAVSRTDTPKPDTGTATGGTIVNDASLDPFSTTTLVKVSDTMTVHTGSVGKIEFSGNLGIMGARDAPTGSFGAIAQWKYKLVGAGSFTNAGAAINDSSPLQVTEVFDPPGYVRTPGSINVARSVTGLTPNTDYVVELWASRDSSTPAKTLSLSGGVSVTGT
ncbi:hypothetical protein KNJ79_02015 [Sphingopyxis indica]|uniref:hypothetical protein n=1 Tax=Sphingopyxis indica TaxID=436663 RepID=UPI002939010F|nr:hypothetical protein [Sphingopyxis indica]WOF43763.1 hypothetical protein KNJ79_02015 [Sphingopyxis indica]